MNVVGAPMRAYYERRAREYDDWWLGTGLFAGRERPGWHEEVQRLIGTLRGLAPAPTLDVACGTAFLTRHLPGRLTALDQSAAMVAIARAQLPGADVVRGEAVPLPFADGSFERVVTSHFYGHLARAPAALPPVAPAHVGATSPPRAGPGPVALSPAEPDALKPAPLDEAGRFLDEARRVAGELVVVDSARRPETGAEQWQERRLDDGSAHRVYKRWFTGAGLAAELGGGEVLLDGDWFVVVRASAITPARAPERP